jgi:mycofactocin system transcriptional regulator
VSKTSPGARPRGRPQGTSARELELIALRLFVERGFEETTVEDIAEAAGVSRRTFFRYFDTKVDVLWHAFDHEVTALRAAFADVPDDVALLDGVRRAVVSVNHYTAHDVPELRARIGLISSVPALQGSAASRYEAWERCVIDFAARRLQQDPEDLLPQAIGYATLAVCRAAYKCWVGQAEQNLTTYLDAAITALAGGFGQDIGD